MQAEKATASRPCRSGEERDGEGEQKSIAGAGEPLSQVGADWRRASGLADYIFVRERKGSVLGVPRASQKKKDGRGSQQPRHRADGSASNSALVATNHDTGHGLPMLDPFDPDSFIIRAEVHIMDIEPKISRTLELPTALNFAQLHEVLQAAFGWTDSHLHQFNIGGLMYGAPEFDEDGLSDSRTFEATEVRLIDLHFPYHPNKNSLTILYQYDFGDNWRHLIRLESVPSEEAVKYPRCVAAARSGPPEDVGGPWGYSDFLEAWFDADHEEHKAMRRWAGRKFDPELCDLERINKAIARAIRVSKGGYCFRQQRPT